MVFILVREEGTHCTAQSTGIHWDPTSTRLLMMISCRSDAGCEAAGRGPRLSSGIKEPVRNHYDLRVETPGPSSLLENLVRRLISAFKCDEGPSLLKPMDITAVAAHYVR